MKLNAPIESPKARQGFACQARGQAPVLLTLILAMLSLATFRSGAAGAPEAPAAPAPTASVKLGEGDVVKITFDATTNLNTLVKLQLDGNIILPMVGEVKAAGKTAAELRKELMQRYAEVLKGEDITVSAMTVASAVYVSGAVLRPGRIPLERPLTVMEALMEAGGMDFNKARPSGVMVFRIVDGKQVQYKVDMKKVLSGKSKEPFYLKPFDTIHVPERTFNF